MERETHDNAWTEFWAGDARRHGGKATASGCLPDGSSGIEQAQRDIWHAFARKLPRAASVLDLATGDGRVMGAMLEVRRDLKPLGIDIATQLPDPPRGAKIKGGVRMCDLPLPDNGFAVATSQFGFEYGDVPATAREVARVLRLEGQLALVTHRSDGPIVTHNRRRREGIAWAIEERDLCAHAYRAIQLRALGVNELPNAIATAPEQGARLHGPQSPAWEIAEAIRQTLVMGSRSDPLMLRATISEIERQAQHEIARIISLEEAAQVASEQNVITPALEGSGFTLIESKPLKDGHAVRPFADFRHYKLTR